MRGTWIGLSAIALGSLLGPSPAVADPVDPFAPCREQLEDAPHQADGYYCIYGAARTSGDFDRGIALLEQILDGDPDNPWAHDNLAALFVDSGRPGFAAHFEHAIEGYAARGLADSEVWASMSYADHLAQTDLDAAERWLQRARRTAADIGDPELVAIADVEWARQLIRRGDDLAEALRLLEASEATVMSQRWYQPRLTLLHTKLRALESVGHVAQAVQAAETMLAANEQVKDFHVAANSLLVLGNMLANDPDLSSERAPEGPVALGRQALELAREYNNRYAEAVASCFLGDLRDGDARTRYEMCANVADEVDDPQTQAMALEGLAVLDAVEDWESSMRTLDEASTLARTRGEDWLGPTVTRALLLWQAGHDKAALATSLALLDEAERTLSRQLNPLTRARVLARWSAVYHAVADRVLAADGADPSPEAISIALQIVERMRGRVLMERLGAARLAPLAPRTMIDAHHEAVRRVGRIQRRLLEEELDDAGREALLAELEGAEREETALSDAVLAADPRLSTLGVEPPTLAQIQAALEPERAILSFQLPSPLPRSAPEPWPVRASVVVITRDDARVVPIPDRDALAPVIDLFNGLFEARDGSEAMPAAGLYHHLLADALDSLPPEVDRLVIVPDGALHRLPFAALRADSQAPPLAERYALSMVPSLRLWQTVHEPPPASRRGAAVFADPELPGAGDGSSAERGWALSLSDELGPLPHARAEAGALARRLGPTTNVHVGASATEARVKQATSEHALLHFASHAVLDEAFPERTAIVLAPGSDAEDGLLQMREIGRLDLAGAAVVLASCSSGSGTVVGGEGPIGLARAFFVAGARTVVASLWRVRDDETRAFFGAFYRHIARGRSVEQAVRAAQNELREAGAPAAAWAGFVVLGDGAYVPFVAPASTVPFGWVALTVLAIALGGAVAWWRRR